MPGWAGSLRQPRLELQYQRTLRCRSALAGRYESARSTPRVFVDLELPQVAVGRVDLGEVPEVGRLRDGVQSGDLAQFASTWKKTLDSHQSMNRHSCDRFWKVQEV